MRFTRARRGATAGSVEVVADAEEVAVLARLVGELLELLGGTAEADPDADPLAAMVGLPSGEVRRPDDPALARLFPDAYDPGTPEGAAAADDFRRYTEADLRGSKRAHGDVVLEDLAALAGAGRLVLAGERTDAWLGCLNDLRLVLGTRLQVTENPDDRGVPDDDPRAFPLHVFGWLGWLQESLLLAIDPGLG